MTEDELLSGITGALEISGWRWMHIIRSDSVTMGDSGFPDIVAIHPTRPATPVLLWELKGTDGKPSPEQVAWIAAAFATAAHWDPHPVDARFLYPSDYDHALDLILGRTLEFAGPPARIVGRP